MSAGPKCGEAVRLGVKTRWLIPYVWGIGNTACDRLLTPTITEPSNFSTSIALTVKKRD